MIEIDVGWRLFVLGLWGFTLLAGACVTISGRGRREDDGK